MPSTPISLGIYYRPKTMNSFHPDLGWGLWSHAISALKREWEMHVELWCQLYSLDDGPWQTLPFTSSLLRLLHPFRLTLWLSEMSHDAAGRGTRRTCCWSLGNLKALRFAVGRALTQQGRVTLAGDLTHRFLLSCWFWGNKEGENAVESSFLQMLHSEKAQ